ncbi:hypothetical protein BB561_001273 [Smittium simulii]|uniref:Uncharacterized protein n=1 Tax=Smittium simulii TaxID=133385 RepID=A0A2T9YVJ7_9FUNG|nr:hypothetical protein BB561_001273 [Smittium simulii]
MSPNSYISLSVLSDFTAKIKQYNECLPLDSSLSINKDAFDSTKLTKNKIYILNNSQISKKDVLEQFQAKYSNENLQNKSFLSTSFFNFSSSSNSQNNTSSFFSFQSLNVLAPLPSQIQFYAPNDHINLLNFIQYFFEQNNDLFNFDSSQKLHFLFHPNNMAFILDFCTIFHLREAFYKFNYVDNSGYLSNATLQYIFKNIPEIKNAEFLFKKQALSKQFTKNHNSKPSVSSTNTYNATIPINESNDCNLSSSFSNNNNTTHPNQVLFEKPDNLNSSLNSIALNNFNRYSELEIQRSNSWWILTRIFAKISYVIIDTTNNFQNTADSISFLSSWFASLNHLTFIITSPNYTESSLCDFMAQLSSFTLRLKFNSSQDSENSSADYTPVEQFTDYNSLDFFNTDLVWSDLHSLDIGHINSSVSRIYKFISFQKFPSLTKISLQNSNLYSIPNELFCLNNLEHLDLSFNKISDVSKISSHFLNLKILDLSWNTIQFLQGIFGLIDLKYLFLQYNSISDIQQIYNLRSLASLTYIYLSYNPFMSINSKWKLAVYKSFQPQNRHVYIDGQIPDKHDLKEMRHIPIPAKTFGVNRVSLGHKLSIKRYSIYNDLIKPQNIRTQTQYNGLGFNVLNKNKNDLLIDSSKSIISNSLIDSNTINSSFPDSVELNFCAPLNVSNTANVENNPNQDINSYSPSLKTSSKSITEKFIDLHTILPDDNFNKNILPLVSHRKKKSLGENFVHNINNMKESLELLRKEAGDSWLKVLYERQILFKTSMDSNKNLPTNSAYNNAFQKIQSNNFDNLPNNNTHKLKNILDNSKKNVSESTNTFALPEFLFSNTNSTCRKNSVSQVNINYHLKKLSDADDLKSKCAINGSDLDAKLQPDIVSEKISIPEDSNHLEINVSNKDGPKRFEDCIVQNTTCDNTIDQQVHDSVFEINSQCHIRHYKVGWSNQLIEHGRSSNLNQENHIPDSLANSMQLYVKHLDKVKITINEQDDSFIKLEKPCNDYYNFNIKNLFNNHLSSGNSAKESLDLIGLFFFKNLSRMYFHKLKRHHADKDSTDHFIMILEFKENKLTPPDFIAIDVPVDPDFDFSRITSNIDNTGNQDFYTTENYLLIQTIYRSTLGYLKDQQNIDSLYKTMYCISCFWSGIADQMYNIANKILELESKNDYDYKCDEFYAIEYIPIPTCSNCNLNYLVQTDDIENPLLETFNLNILSPIDHSEGSNSENNYISQDHILNEGSKNQSSRKISYQADSNKLKLILFNGLVDKLSYTLPINLFSGYMNTKSTLSSPTNFNMPLQILSSPIRLMMQLMVFSNENEKILQWSPNSYLVQNNQSKFEEYMSNPKQFKKLFLPSLSENPAFLALSNFNIYIFVPNADFWSLISIPSKKIKAYFMNNYDNLQMKEIEDANTKLFLAIKAIELNPELYLELKYIIPLKKIKKFDVGPNRQYLVVHNALYSMPSALSQQDSGSKPQSKNNPGTSEAETNNDSDSTNILDSESLINNIQDVSKKIFNNIWFPPIIPNFSKSKDILFNKPINSLKQSDKTETFDRSKSLINQKIITNLNKSETIHKDISDYKIRSLSVQIQTQKNEINNSTLESERLNLESTTQKSKDADKLHQSKKYHFTYQCNGFLPRTIVATSAFIYIVRERLDVWPPPTERLIEFYEKYQTCSPPTIVTSDPASYDPLALTKSYIQRLTGKNFSINKLFNASETNGKVDGEPIIEENAEKHVKDKQTLDTPVDCLENTSKQNLDQEITNISTYSNEHYKNSPILKSLNTILDSADDVDKIYWAADLIKQYDCVERVCPLISIKSIEMYNLCLYVLPKEIISDNSSKEKSNINKSVSINDTNNNCGLSLNSNNSSTSSLKFTDSQNSILTDPVKSNNSAKDFQGTLPSQTSNIIVDDIEVNDLYGCNTTGWQFIVVIKFDPNFIHDKSNQQESIFSAKKSSQSALSNSFECTELRSYLDSMNSDSLSSDIKINSKELFSDKKITIETQNDKDFCSSYFEWKVFFSTKSSGQEFVNTLAELILNATNGERKIIPKIID